MGAAAPRAARDAPARAMQERVVERRETSEGNMADSLVCLGLCWPGENAMGRGVGRRKYGFARGARIQEWEQYGWGGSVGKELEERVKGVVADTWEGLRVGVAEPKAAPPRHPNVTGDRQVGSG